MKNKIQAFGLVPKTPVTHSIPKMFMANPRSEHLLSGSTTCKHDTAQLSFREVFCISLRVSLGFSHPGFESFLHSDPHHSQLSCAISNTETSPDRRPRLGLGPEPTSTANLFFLPTPISMGVWRAVHKENSLFLISPLFSLLLFLSVLFSLSLYPSSANDKHPFIRRGIRISNAIC